MSPPGSGDPVPARAASGLTRRPWGEIGGAPVGLTTLESARGLLLSVCDLGAIVTRLLVPDRHGRRADVVLGLDALADYAAGHPWFGCVVGRCSNRIAGARFELDGEGHALPRNDGRHHLHGGPGGFHARLWSAEDASAPGRPAVRLARTSPAGEEGYPGTLAVQVTYALSDAVLSIDMRARTDAPTVVSLAQHTWWNLAGHDAGPVHGHRLRLHASAVLPVDTELIPTGALADVAGTPFDLRAGAALGPRLSATGGFDHCFVVDGEERALRPVAELADPASGRTLALAADQPGCQLYTANGLHHRGKDGAAYGPHHALCLETQHFPDAIHHPRWPSPVLRPGEEYRHRMELRFGVDG